MFGKFGLKLFFVLSMVFYCTANAFGVSDIDIEKKLKQIDNLVNRIEILEQNVSNLQRKSVTQDLNSDDAGSVKKEPITEHVSSPKSVENHTKNDAKKMFFVEKGQSIVSHDKQEYDSALSLLKDGKYDEAEEKFASFVEKYPDSRLKSNAMFWHAETFFHRNNYDKAAVQYLKSYKFQPKGAKAADSLLKLSIVLGELKKKKEACAILDKLDNEFPNRPLTSIKRSKDTKLKFNCN